MTLEELNRLKDPLTGFHARTALSDYINNLITTSKDQNKIFSLLILDIDHFKIINDKYGHLCGDEALRFFATIINEALRGEHFVARYGGDEFLIVIDNKGQKDTLEIAKHIKRLLNKRFFICKEKPLLIKTSMGIATFPLEGKNLVELLKNADEALYYAKNHGRNKIILSSRLRYIYSKNRVIRIAILSVALAVLLFVYLYKSNLTKLVNVERAYRYTIIQANYLSHKLKYKYNYALIELANGSKLEGWIIREDKDKIYLSQKKPDFNTEINEVSKKNLRIYIKILKK
ncbi:MAG: GGDEF domain-containing protein [Candidatus Omnitrophota bacterium]|nr:GGDEF domain-containing protein [Candidatus Omnitrophota bacterium]